MHKLSQSQNGAWVEHSYAPYYALPDPCMNGRPLMATAPSGDPMIFNRLTNCLNPPFLLLYVLHTPRGEGEHGRYQSPPLSTSRFDAFIEKFSAYLQADSRFDLWAHSPEENATVVWDRHNLVFAYGPLDRFISELDTMGFRPGSVDIPAPHAHNYHRECDSAAKDVLSEFEWTFSPLHPGDEQ